MPAESPREVLAADVRADAAAELLQELSLARLAALEAYDRAVPRLLAALADDVLGRELAVASADLGTLAAELRARFAREEPVAVVIAPTEPFAECTLPVRRDPALHAGDLILEVRDGEVDARFRLRCAAAIAGSAHP
jgi:flagellar biosynthesis/type III secretory pathway protein FliH